VLVAAAVALVALLVCVGGNAYAQGYENTATARDGSGAVEGAVEGSSGQYYAKAADQQFRVVTANSGNEADAYSFVLVNANDEKAAPITPSYTVEDGATGVFTLLVNPTEQQFADAIATSGNEDFKAADAYKQLQRLLYAALVDPDDLKGAYNLTDADLWALVNAQVAKIADPNANASFTGDKAKAFKALSDYALSDAADNAADFKDLEVHLYLACGDSPAGMVNLVSARFAEKAAADGKKIAVPSWKAEATTDTKVEQIYVDADDVLVDWPEGQTTTIELVENGEPSGKTAELTADEPAATFEGVRNDAACTFATAEPLPGIAYAWGGVEAGFTIASVEGEVSGDTTFTVGAEFYGLDGNTRLEQGLPESVKARVLVDGEEAALIEPGADNNWSASADVALPESGLVTVSGESLDGFDLVMTRGGIDGSYTLVYQEKGYIVPIAAIDNSNGEQVAGAGLRAVGTTEAGLPTSVDLTTTDGDDTMILPAGTFKLQQVTDPEGFTVMGDVDFVVMDDEGDGGSAVVDEAANENAANDVEGSINLMEDGEGFDVTILKVDSEKYAAATDKSTLEGIGGATITISGTDASGSAVAQTVTSTSDASGVKVKLPEGTYTLTETEAPEGYIKSADISITIASSGAITSDAYDEELGMIVVQNTRTKVVVSKRIKDKTDELAGAKLAIQDTNGVEVVNWTTTNRKKAIRELAVGEYQLVELVAPTGYDKAEAISFRMNEDGTVEVKDGDSWTKVDELVMYDAPNGILKTKSPVTNGANGGSSLAKTGDEGGLLGLGIIALLGGAMVVEGMVLSRRRRDRD
jgi:hypothetical protein